MIERSDLEDYKIRIQEFDEGMTNALTPSMIDIDVPHRFRVLKGLREAFEYPCIVIDKGDERDDGFTLIYSRVELEPGILYLPKTLINDSGEMVARRDGDDCGYFLGEQGEGWSNAVDSLTNNLDSI